ncbi:MAG: 16S rRNA (guanine(527)-N(7))-methyltransferase RsmG [Coriobacteriia bacterium]|nr:16S rRNA (guanine(527)-N(7))-methyltransferase RsmG [Coriobacteriia bacterium]
MKQIDRRAIAEALARIGLSTTGDKTLLLAQHLALVLEANERLNLTRITTEEEALRLHIVDSLVPMPELTDAPAGMIVDVGTGAGYPGIPLAIISGRQSVLLDSVKKKAAAVQGMVDRLSLSEAVQVVAERAEEHAFKNSGVYAVVVARAVSSLPALVELASPLLSAGGHLIALKGALLEEEIARGQLAGNLVGMAEKSRRTIALPGGGEVRTVIVFEKSTEAKIALPRRSGLAQRAPLA